LIIKKAPKLVKVSGNINSAQTWVTEIEKLGGDLDGIIIVGPVKEETLQFTMELNNIVQLTGSQVRSFFRRLLTMIERFEISSRTF